MMSSVVRADASWAIRLVDAMQCKYSWQCAILVTFQVGLQVIAVVTSCSVCLGLLISHSCTGIETFGAKWHK